MIEVLFELRDELSLFRSPNLLMMVIPTRSARSSARREDIRGNQDQTA
jgi:hypothetical protein